MGNLLAQAVTAVIQMKDHGSGIYGSTIPPELGSGQLATGFYSDRSVDPVLIYPRPDSETPAWAKHRRQHPSVAYRQPIGISFGSWPFIFESIVMPSGATVGTQLIVSGDQLVPGPDYGVVHWDVPTIGFHSFHVRVHFQDGFPPIDVQWTTEVTIVGTIFVHPNPAIGSDTTGDGTFELPFQTADAWWKDDFSDLTYSEFQVCYLEGTHDVSVTNVNTGVGYGNWQLNGTDKPLVHYGAYGSNVIFDMSNTQMVHGQVDSIGGGVRNSDVYYGGIKFLGMNAVADNPKHFVFNDLGHDAVYDPTGESMRNTWFETEHEDAICFTTSTNNAGICWAPNAGGGRKRHFWYQSKILFKNCFVDPTATETAGGNFNGFYLSNTVNWLAENSKCINTTFGKNAFAAKTGCINACQRNVDYIEAPLQNIYMDVAGSYDPNAGGPYEISYCRQANTGSDTLAQTIEFNAGFDPYDAGNAGHLPIYCTRNTFSKAPVASRSLMRTNSGWPVVFKKNVLVGDDLLYLDVDPVADGENFISYSVANNPLDSNLNLLDPTEKAANFGKFGHGVAV